MPGKFEIATTFKGQDKVSPTLSRLRTRFARFTGSVSRSFKKVSARFASVQAGMTSGLTRIAAVGTAVFGGMFLAVRRVASEMDTLAKTTRAINFPIEEFQEWRFAAEQSGVSSDVFEKALGKFTKGVGELRGGYGVLQTSLKKTRPELMEQIKGTEDVSKAFELYLTAIRETPNAMDKAALATAAFGRSGIQFVNMANNSAESLEELRGQMRENGVVTADQAQAAEAYNDMMNRVSLTIKGFLVTVLTPLMPMLTDIADQFRRWSVESRGAIADEFKRGLKWVIDNFESIVYWAKKIGGALAIFYGLSTAIRVVSGVLTAFNVIAAANPIGLIVIATAAAIAAIILFRDEIDAFMFKLFDAVVFLAGVIRNAFASAWDWVTEKTRAFFDGVSMVVRTWSSVINDLVEGVVALFTGQWDKAYDAFARVFTRIRDFASGIFDWLGNRVGAVVDTIAGLFGGGEVGPVVVDSASVGGAPKAGGIVAGTTGPTSGPTSLAGPPAVPATDAIAGGLSAPVVHTVESRSTNVTEVVIRDDTGRAEVTRGSDAPGFSLVPTGGHL